MCTAMTFKNQDRYCGRTLDYEQSFGEAVVITPRNWSGEDRYAMVGMATVAEGTPLYYDAVNENGLFMAGLMFKDAAYLPHAEGKLNLCPHQLIPYLLGRCADLRDVQVLMERLNVVAGDFNTQFRCAPLHWLIADRNRAAVLEVNGAVHLYEDPYGVLTNAPDFPKQVAYAEQFSVLSPHSEADTRGEKAVGLPGDWSSPSRFVRAAFVQKYGRCDAGEDPSVSHFFRMLQSVSVPKGCMRLEQGDAYTRYACCCNQDRGIYYCSAYEDPRIMAVELKQAEGTALKVFSVK